MSGCVGKLRFSRIYNNLLRTLTLIVFGFANINNGLTSYVSKESHNTSSSSSSILSGSVKPISSLSSSLLTTEHMKFLQNEHLTLQQQQQFQLQLKQLQEKQQKEQQQLHQQQQHSIVNQNKLIMSLHSSVLNHTPRIQLTSKDSIDLVNNNFNTNTNNNNNNNNKESVINNIESGSSGSTIIGINSRTSDNIIINNNNNKNNNNGISNLLSSDSLISENGNSLLLSGNSDNINLKSSSLLISNSGISSSNNDNVNSNNQIINDNIIDNTDNNNNNNNNNVNKQQLQQLQQQQTDSSSLDEIYNTPMYFGTENNTVITTQIGATAHMPCTIHHIGDGVVSWIRRKDYHLLTVGLTTYNSDERFSATHLKHSEDWTLQIKFVQLRDAGIYECQVSTHPPTSIFLHLNVVEARAEISGPPIRYLTPGSTLRLQCRVLQNTQPSEFIFWYHDNRMINYDIDRGINVSTEADFQSSELVIQRTRREHSGNFTCMASNAQPASVLVHIFKGDNPAAMYHGHVGSSNKSYQNQFFVNLLLIISIGKSLVYHSSINFFNFKFV